MRQLFIQPTTTTTKKLFKYFPGAFIEQMLTETLVVYNITKKNEGGQRLKVYRITKSYFHE